MELTVDTNLREVSVRYDEAPALIAQNVVSMMQQVAREGERMLKGNALSGGVLKVRSGNLRRAVYSRVVADPSDRSVAAQIGVDMGRAGYAHMLNEGGTITPKHAKNLAIPVGKALTPAGIGRVSARQFFENPGVLGYATAWVYKGRTVMGTTKGGRPEAVFLLRRSVTMPAFHYLETVLKDLEVYARGLFGMVAKGVPGGPA